MNTEQCLKWGRKILNAEGLSDWFFDWSYGASSEGVTLFKTKTIALHWPIDKPWPALVLHEIAHAKRGEIAGHDSQFAHDYMALVTRWTLPNAVQPEGKALATVRVEGQDKVPLAWLFRASGEGSTDYRICRTLAEVRQAYIDCVTGDDEGAIGNEIADFMTQFEDENDESWQGDLFTLSLYCAEVEIHRFPAGVLFAQSPLAPPEEKP